MTYQKRILDTFKRALFDNILLKFIAIASSLSFYAYIHSTDNAHRSFDIPIVANMPEKDMKRQLLTQLPAHVVVTVRGSRTQLDDLRSDDFSVLQLDLRDGRKSSIVLDASMLHVPSGLQIERIFPSSLSFEWDERIEKSLGVQVNLGPAPNGYTKKELQVDPKTILAVGPKSILSKLKFVNTISYDLSEVQEGIFDRSIPLQQMNFIQYNIENVNVEIEMSKIQSHKRFSKIKVEPVGNIRVRILPGFVDVDVAGPDEELRNLLPSDLLVYIDLKAQNFEFDFSKPGESLAQVKVKLPRGKAQSSPEKVLVRWP